jgi:hypothetical protein
MPYFPKRLPGRQLDVERLAARARGEARPARDLPIQLWRSVDRCAASTSRVSWLSDRLREGVADSFEAGHLFGEDCAWRVSRS